MTIARGTAAFAALSVLLGGATAVGAVAHADPNPASRVAACADRQPAPHDTSGFAPGRIGSAWPGMPVGRNGKAVVFAAVATTSGDTLGFIPLASNGKALVPDFAASSQAKVKPRADLLIDARQSTLDAYTTGEHVTVVLSRHSRGWQVDRVTSVRCIT